jgi:hypothetical protein
MYLPSIPILADPELIYQQRQTLINCNACCNNCCCIYLDYEVGDEVLVKVYKCAGLEQGAVGLFTIEEQVHVNRMLTIQHLPNVSEQICIC